MDNALEGEHLCSTNCASDPSRTRACSAAVHDRRSESAHRALVDQQQFERYVLCSTNRVLTTLPAALPETFGQLTAMTFCDLRYNKLAGTYSFITRTMPNTCVRRAAPRNWEPEGTHGARAAAE